MTGLALTDWLPILALLAFCALLAWAVIGGRA